MTTTSTTRWITATCLALAVGAACDADGRDEDRDDESAGAWVERVTYVQDWIWGDASPRAEGPGWTTTTDLGYAVEIERASLTTFSIALVPCPEAADDGLLARAEELLLPTAHAGHSGETDPSAMEDPVIEDLARPAATMLGTVEFPAARYCRVHLLSAAASSGADGATVSLAGRMRMPGAERWSELGIESSLANGTFLDLPAGLELAAGDELMVVVHRRIDSLLDGIDLGHAEPVAVERQLLLDLMHGASLDASAVTP